MKEFKAFYFESFRFDEKTLKAHFQYSFDKAEYFEEEIDFSCDGFTLREGFDLEDIKVFLFQIHMALGISYYKLFPTQDLFVESGYLDEKQLDFWKKFYKNGLGEFLYKNKITPHNLLNFHANSDLKYQLNSQIISEKSLVPLGGGKDSMVTIELLKGKNNLFDTVVFGKLDKIKETISQQLKEQNLLIKRQMSQNLFRLNDMQYYNGHVPITGIIAFVLYAAAYMYDYKHIIMSNELSADEGNFEWEGFEVNHQYSKSLEFERDLREYSQNYITENIYYFSLLRGMYEYKIAELFALKCQKYFSSFASCNKNFFIQSQAKHRGNWCLSCEKCAFVFMILGAHLDYSHLMKIFGENLYEIKELQTTFLDLLGIGEHKPFECVGTNEECVVSLYRFFEKNPKEGRMYGILDDLILSKMTEKDIQEIEIKLLKIEDEDNIPIKIKSEVLFSSTLL